ncbi:uncharacterized protein LOC106646519, partial [Copidosoma floridanum]|uniref:uncharacterized protein LOC106646519 n=1 Tax=Copidosoma floridanum TaxID=29053 RepID=UPI0006C969C5
EESAEEQLDGWADIEAVYAPTSTPAGESAADNPPATVQRAATESYDDEDSEDSDQDWILPGSRKRKRKRSSASRRLKTFQNKIQNIQEHNAAEDNQSLHPSPDKAAIARQLSNRKYNQQISKNALNRSIASVPIGTAPTAIPGTGEGLVVKSESQDPNLHSVLDIKDEGPIYDSAASSQPNVTVGVQPNYVVTTGQSPVANYYVMQQNPTAVVSQSQYIQSAAYVPQMMQTVQSQGYYVQSANPAQNYLVQAPSRPAYLSSTTPVVYQQVGGPQLISTQQPMIRGAPNYVQYVGAPMHPQQQQRLAQPRIINTTTLSPARQIAYGARAPFYRMPGPVPIGQRPNFPHPPNGAVIRSAPLSSNVLRPGQRTGPPRIPEPRQVLRMPNPGSKKPVPVKGNLGRAQKNSSLIVLSDSDDDIEMIIPGGSTSMLQSKQTAPPPKKSAIPPELLERMNEGGISLSPIKPAPQPAQQSNSSTQLVVVVNETGSHYALVLPNGSKLILTPDQVAQLRAANGGKLVL